MALTVLDAGVVIGVLDADDQHHPGAVEALRERLTRGDRMVVPASAYAETLVGAFRRDEETAAAVELLYADTNLHVEPLTPDIARSAARLRARHGNRLRLPDAFVVATAEALEARSVVTTDRRWPDGLPVTIEFL